MASEFENNILQDKLPWTKNPFSVRFGYRFKSYREVLEYQQKDKFINSPDSFDSAGLVKKNEPSAAWKDGMKEAFNDNDYYKINGADTTVGGNDAINCLWQFGRDDDIVHATGHTMGPDIKNQWKGMGRVYSEMYDKQQQILWMGFGVPEYSGIDKFYRNAFNSDMVAIQNTGGQHSFMSKLGGVLGTIGATAFAFPIIAARWAAALPNDVANLIKGAKAEQSKYYDMRMSMPLYYSHVNFILLSLAVNMNLYNGGYNTKDDERMMEDNLPKVFPHGKLDIYAIIKRRSQRYMKASEGIFTTTDEIIARAVNKDTSDNGWKNRFTGALGVMSDTAVDKFQYLGFRIEKSTDSSESISNSTGQSSIAQMINSQTSESMDKMFTAQIGAHAEQNENILTSAAGAVKDFLNAGAQSFTSVFGAAQSSYNVMMGNGFVDIPEVWKESSFSKSYSFNANLRCHYGDPLSIFQSIYVPLACLLAAALPRAVGCNGYTSPFIVRAYSKGMFSIPIGMIDGMSIRRGSSEHGWSYGNLPTCVDVSFTIKDLSPAMFLAVGSGSDQSIMDIFSENTSFQEYLATLSGFGLQQRLSRWEQINKRMKLNWRLLWDERLNPERMAMDIGNSSVLQMIFAPTPFNGLSEM